MELDPIEHYDAKHAGLIPARFYKDREGVMRHLTGDCESPSCGTPIEDHGWKTSYDDIAAGFVGLRVSGNETD